MTPGDPGAGRADSSIREGTPPPAGLSVVVAGSLALVLMRSIVFVFFEGANFDSDQAVFGLMAKHLAELRAFPLFSYEQSYMLAVTTWLAAPVVAVLGPTVTALKLPVLAINLAFAWLLVVALVRDARLPPWGAFTAALPFVLPPVVTSALLTQHSGGNVEPFLWVLLLWVLRSRPAAFGVVAAVGCLQREFTAYGIVALVVIEVLRGRLRERGRRVFWLRATLAGAFVVLLVHALRQFSTYPGQRAAGIGWKGLEPAFDRASALLERTLPLLAGFLPYPVHGLNVRSTLVQAPLGLLLGVATVVTAFVLAVRLLRRARLPWRLDGHLELLIYLALVGAQTLVAYVLFGRGRGSDAYVRYILLALLLAVAALAVVLRRETAPWARRLAIVVIVAWAVQNAVDHGRLAAEYFASPPENPYRVLADDLVAHGVRYGAADYWVAYHVTYLARERVKLHARGFNRVGEYRTLFFDNLPKAVDVRMMGPCQGGRVVGGFCVVGPPAPRKRIPQAAEDGGAASVDEPARGPDARLPMSGDGRG
jgi:hypothetical protein